MTAGGFDLDAATQRVWRFLWLLAAAGAIGFGAVGGVGSGASFLFGSLISALSLALTHKMVMSIGKPDARAPATWKSVLLGARWLVLAGIFYAMMKLFGLVISAAMCGMLVAAGAVILEIFYEIIHGT